MRLIHAQPSTNSIIIGGSIKVFIKTWTVFAVFSLVTFATGNLFGQGRGHRAIVPVDTLSVGVTDVCKYLVVNIVKKYPGQTCPVNNGDEICIKCQKGKCAYGQVNNWTVTIYDNCTNLQALCDVQISYVTGDCTQIFNCSTVFEKCK